MVEMIYHQKEQRLVTTQLEELGIFLPQEYCVQLALVQVGNGFLIHGDHVNQIRSLIYVAANSGCQAVFLPVSMEVFGVVYLFTAAEVDLRDKLEHLAIDIESLTHSCINSSYSLPSHNFMDLAKLFEQAKTALEQGCSMNSSVFSYMECYTQDKTQDIGKHIGASKNYAVRMQQFINEHYMQPIVATDVSQAVFLSPNHANRCFAKETGTTIYDYITQCRISKAKQLLSETDMQITCIAEHVGYNGKTNFYLAFKRNVGMSPNEFRNAAQNIE